MFLKNKLDTIVDMKNINKNPLAWFILAVLLGWWMNEGDNINNFIIVISAVILAKQIEILNKDK